MLEFNAAVTGVGSLPHVAAEPALALVREVAPEVPWWPQLPLRDARESMIASGLAALSAVDGVSIAPTTVCVRAPLSRVVEALEQGAPDAPVRAAAAFEPFLKSQWPGALVVKGQQTGPLTLLRCVRVVEGGIPRALHDRERAELREAVVASVTRHAAWQARRLRALGAAIVVVDEPMLPAALRDWSPIDAFGALQPVLDAIRAGGALAGLHCCDALPLDVLSGARPDLISFDVNCGAPLESVCADSRMRAFLESGGAVAWGVVPTTRAQRDAEVVAARWLSAVRVLGDPIAIVSRSLFTAACGFGLSDESGARRALADVAAVSATIQRTVLG